MILATDLDRTLLPNGDEPYDGTLPEFFDMVRHYKFTLVYVSGRNLSMLEDAEREYGIELPDYFIGEVGTVVYQKVNERLVLHEQWGTYIKKMNPTWNRERIVESLADILELDPQEDEKQNPYKISFYIHETNREDEILSRVKNACKEFANLEIVYSTDPLLNGVGLLDVLPKAATKLSALEFVRNTCNVPVQDVVYCGDSGNDILPLTSGYRGILVRNAHPNIVNEVCSFHKANGSEKNIYHAIGTEYHNGNYSSGIIEGLEHYGVVTHRHAE